MFNKILVAYGVAYSAKDLAEVIRAKRWNLDDNLKAANAGLGLTGAGAAGTKGFATLMKPLANSSPKWATVGKFAGRVNPIALGLQANIVGYQVGKGRADTLIEQEAKGLDTVGIAKQDLSDRPWYAKPVGGYNVLTAKTRREAGEHFFGVPEYKPDIGLSPQQLAIINAGLKARFPGAKVVSDIKVGTYTVSLPTVEGMTQYTVDVKTGKRVN